MSELASFRNNRVIGRRQESLAPFEKVSARLSNEIKIQRVEEAQRNLILNLVRKADIHTILDENWDEYWAKAASQSRPAASP